MAPQKHPAPRAVIQVHDEIPPPQPPPPIVKRNPLPLAGLSYTKCTAKELRQSVEARDPGTTRPNNNRKQLREKLRQLDTDWNFRFMDLPPELRVIVYNEVLKPNPKTKRSANANIVLASKLVQREAEAILYALNTISIEFYVRPQTLFDGKVLPRRDQYQAALSGYGLVAAEYATFPKPTCLKIQHLRLRVSLDEWEWDYFDEDGEINNQALLALANVFGGSSSLKTVDIHGYHMYPQGNLTNRQVEKQESMLYPLTKLQSSDVEGTLHKRAVTFNVVDGRVKRRLKRRLAAGTPRPVDAIGVLEDLKDRAQRVKKHMDRFPPLDPEFDVFMSALDIIAKEEMLTGRITHDADSQFCRKVKSLKTMFEDHQEKWEQCVCENVWEAMHGAQGGIHWESNGDAEDWLDEQRITFEVLRIDSVVGIIEW